MNGSFGTRLLICVPEAQVRTDRVSPIPRLGFTCVWISDFWTSIHFHVHVIHWEYCKSKQDILCFIDALYTYLEDSFV